MYEWFLTNPRPPSLLRQGKSPVGNTTHKMITLSISEFKTRFNVETINIVRNPKTGKLFVSTANGNYKCQGTFDPAKPAVFLGESHEDLCLINQDTTNVIGTL